MFFAVVYFLCGISDISDGYIARRLGAETKFGAKLDSAGDFIFYAVWMFIFLAFINIGVRSIVIICITAITAIRAVNLAITKAKFKQWGVIHTVGNKLTGIILFLLLPVCIFIGSIPSLAIIAVSVLAALSAFEECIILLKSKTYDVDKQSIFIRKKDN